jgi:hypothetical protein
MDNEAVTTDPELEIDATRDIYKLLKPLDSTARVRVVTHVASMLGIVPSTKLPELAETLAPTGRSDESLSGQENGEFATFAEFFDALDPQTEADKALAAGYWIQVGEKAESFDAQSANKELKHLGHAAGNITQALSALMQQKPALVVQLKKSGSSRQARKTYKVTQAGVNEVKEKLGG